MLADTEAEFDEQLTASLEHWQREGTRSVQIYFKPPKCHLINVALKHGFYFHHTHKKDGYVLMCKWMDQTMADRLPAYANHYVGVGAVVVNENEEVLLTQEKRWSVG